MKIGIIIHSLLIVFGIQMKAQKKWIETPKGSYSIIQNQGGQTLGYSPSSGIKIIQIEGLAFKDLNKNGFIDSYEDWRKPVAERASDLASKMTVEQIAGLMLFSRYQTINTQGISAFAETYNGKPFSIKENKPTDLSDQQIVLFTKDNLRHVLMTAVENPEFAVTLNNKMQALVEGIGLGIPFNNGSDVKSLVNKNSIDKSNSARIMSQWPFELGLAATFNPEITQQFGSIAAKEYRAMGVTTILSPQIDLATEPRWNRFAGTFGEDPKLATEMARAYIDGFQTSARALDSYEGWGVQSVNAMVKHWPGGGPEEGGRDAHFASGKFAVYPGAHFETHLKPFLEGAFKLKGSTKKASAVMPYYTISFNQDTKNAENVGSAFSKYIITDLLRNKFEYNGVVCTDWIVTADEGNSPDLFFGKCWGVEKLSVSERHYKALMAGVDQFGGNTAIIPILEAYQMGVKEQGESFMRNRFEESAVRLLLNIFRVGLFENAYLDITETKAIVGNSVFMKAGYDAQLKSIVMIKNQNNTLPIQKRKTVYVPKIITPVTLNFFGKPIPEKVEYPVNLDAVKKYYNVSEDPNQADFALVFIKSPISGGYSKSDRVAGGNGYVPISLQLKEYTAVDARAQSIAAGDPVVDPTITNRSYLNKTSKSNSYPDLNTILDTKKAMNGKPIIVAVNSSNPMVFSEFEKEVDAIVMDFGVQIEALLDIVSGKIEPSGLLPFQMPMDMSTVEKQFEDVPHDMIPYQDSIGNTYDFGFGLNWNGIIKDARTIKYSIKK